MTSEPRVADGEATPPEARPQRRREWRGVLPSLLLPVLLLAAIGGAIWYWERPADGPAVVELDAPAPKAEVPKGSPHPGEQAPGFTLPALDGGSLSLASLRGRPVIVNFWATWCAPCRQEVPELARLAAEHRTDGLAIVGVDIQESAAEVRPFVDEFQPGFPILLDTQGDAVRAYHVNGAPTSFFIGRDGKVQAVVIGPLTDDRLKELLPALLGQGAR